MCPRIEMVVRGDRIEEEGRWSGLIGDKVGRGGVKRRDVESDGEEIGVSELRDEVTRR